MAHMIHAQLETEFYYTSEYLAGKGLLDAFEEECTRNNVRPLGLRAGHPYPSEAVQLRIRLYTNKHPKHGFFTTVAGLAVDNRIRNIFDAIEPGVHRFHPVDLRLKDDTPVEDQHYLLNCCTKVDAIDPARSNVKIKSYNLQTREFDNIEVSEIANREHYFYSAISGTKRGLVVLRERVEGRAMWYEPRISELMFSDKVFDAAIDAGVQGFEDRPYVDEI